MNALETILYTVLAILILVVLILAVVRNCYIWRFEGYKSSNEANNFYR